MIPIVTETLYRPALLVGVDVSQVECGACCLSRLLGSTNIPREMDIQDFVKEYQSKTEEELLRLELVSEQLTPDAIAALQDELARRQINGTDRLSAFRKQEAQRQTEQARDPGRLFSVYSIGRSRFGKARPGMSTIRKRGWNGLRRQFSSYSSISR